MSATYPTVGKTYLGHENQHTRVAFCKWCGQRQELVSYDTHLWFVAALIPVFRLGKKRIVDFCPACGFHVVFDWREWEMARQLEVTGAGHLFRRQPSAETCVELHGQYLFFHRTRDANQIESVMETDYAKNARVQAYLGDVRMEQGKEDMAMLFYRRALALRPDLPEAKIALAFDSMRNDKLAEARSHLSFLEQPGAAQLYPMEPLNLLANAYVRAKRIPEALQIYSTLLEAFPEAGQNRQIRKHIRTIEKEAKKKDSILPRKKIFSSTKNKSAQGGPRKVALRLLALGLFAALVYVMDWSGRQQRALYLVNSTDSPLEVSIHGTRQVRANPGVAQANVAEGEGAVAIRGLLHKTVPSILSSSGFLAGVFQKPVWVLDAGENTLFVRETATYGATEPKLSKVSKEEFVYGSALFAAPEVDLLFQPFPETSGRQQLTRFVPFTGSAMSAVEELINAKEEQEALNLAEWFLARPRLNEELFRLYCSRYAFTPGYSDRVRKFLFAGLTRRPVEIEWHRNYQDILLKQGKRAELAAFYQELLQADAGNAPLLYLRSRVAETPSEAAEFLGQALAIDAADTYSGYALAYQEMVQCNFVSAAERFRKVSDTDPSNQAFFESYMLAARGSGRSLEAEEAARKRLGERRGELGARLALLDSLLEQNRGAEAEQVIEECPADQAKLVRFSFLYQTAQPQELGAITRSDATPRGREYQLAALLEQGKIEEAEKLAGKDPFQSLMFSLAWLVSGNKKNAESAQARAVEFFKRDPDPDLQRVAVLLDSKAAPDRAQLDNIVVSLKNKALLCAVMAAKFPKNPELAQQAGALNVDRTPPYRLICRALSPAPKSRSK